MDDESLAREGVRARLAAHADLHWVGEAGDGDEALRVMEALKPDLVFMDVQMPGICGIDVLRHMEPDRRPLAILLTAYEQFAVDAFALHALDYLLKPIDDQRFREALDRARTAMRHRGHAESAQGEYEWTERLSVRVGLRTVIVEASDIDWIEASGDYAGMHVGQQVHLLREPLHKLSLRLRPTAVSAHSSFDHRAT
ncbi:LytR/AlgR family response regulator transcription factor [Dyella terrae]|uniref:LytR/AlgR family response regulator transcription factor n=1 Tax=Dyella terrae TaxID=522259 RepID=UPI001EFE5955|nr:response regulator [Dyella terrae]